MIYSFSAVEQTYVRKTEQWVNMDKITVGKSIA